MSQQLLPVPLDNIQLPDLVSTQILRTPLVDNAMEGASAAKKKVVDTGVTTVVQNQLNFLLRNVVRRTVLRSKYWALLI